MTALKDLQKDLESRKYKLNPFEKKYVDLTISSCVAGDYSNDDSSGLDHLSKSIRARSDIISCQVEFLVKEAMRVFDITSRDVANASGEASNKTDLKEDKIYFIEEDRIVDQSKHSLLDCLGTTSNSDLPQEVISAKLPWLEELAKSFEISNLKEIISPFLAVQSPCALPLISEISKSTRATLNGSCTEILLQQNREEVDKRLNLPLSVGAGSTVSVTRFLRFVRPFTFDSNDKFEEERDRALINKISEVEVHHMQKVYGLDAELTIGNNLIRSEEGFDGLSRQTYNDDSGHNLYSFVSDDSKKMKSRKDNQSVEVSRQLLEESDFQDGANSDSDRSEYMFETMKKLENPSSSAASSRKLLSTLSAKISKVSEVKKNAKDVDNIFGEKRDIIINEENANISSVSTTLKGIPKLLDLHSARLKQDNALANLNSNSKGSQDKFRSMIADNADDLLLPIPTNPLEHYKKKCDIKEGVDRSTIHFLQNSLAESYSLYQDTGTVTNDGLDKNTRERVNEEDCIRFIYATSIPILSSGFASKALRNPEVTTRQSINCKTNCLWSPMGPGFGLDKDLWQLLKELRPLQFADSAYQLIQSREASKVNADDEWGNIASLFRSNYGEGYEVDEVTDWGQKRRNDEIFDVNICDNLIFNLRDDVTAWPVEICNKEDDDFRYFDTDADERKCEKRLSGNGMGSDSSSKRRKSDDDGGCHIDQERDINSDDSDNSVHSTNDVHIGKSKDFEVTNIIAAPVRINKYKKNLQASSTSELTAATIICRPLLPLSIVQQLIRRFISPPPSRSLIKLNAIIPHDLVTDSYPNIDCEEGKALYAKRVFIGLLFLADSYNRQKSAAHHICMLPTSAPSRNPIQIHLSNDEKSSVRSCSVVAHIR